MKRWRSYPLLCGEYICPVCRREEVAVRDVVKTHIVKAAVPDGYCKRPALRVSDLLVRRDLPVFQCPSCGVEMTLKRVGVTRIMLSTSPERVREARERIDTLLRTRYRSLQRVRGKEVNLNGQVCEPDTTRD